MKQRLHQIFAPVGKVELIQSARLSNEPVTQGEQSALTYAYFLQLRPKASPIAYKCYIQNAWSRHSTCAAHLVRIRGRRAATLSRKLLILPQGILIRTAGVAGYSFPAPFNRPFFHSIMLPNVQGSQTIRPTGRESASATLRSSSM